MKLAASMLLIVLLVLLVGFLAFHHLREQGRKIAADRADSKTWPHNMPSTVTVIEGHNEGGGGGGSGAGGTSAVGGRVTARVWIVDEKGLASARSVGGGSSGSGGSSMDDHSFYYNGKQYVPTGEPGIFREMPEERPHILIRGIWY